MAFGRKLKPPPPGLPDINEIRDDIPQQAMISGSPNLFQIEEVLQALGSREMMNVWQTRVQLKWLIKIARRELNIHFESPYDIDKS